MLKGHKKTYVESMGYVEFDFIPCEICDGEAVDIHHIECRGMGGTTNPYKNSIFNLMALCRNCHVYYGDKSEHMHFLKISHAKVLIIRMQTSMKLDDSISINED